MAFLTPAFFQRDVLTVAQDLIGVELVWLGCSGIIVETEAYAVDGDPACHTASRPSARAFVQNHPPGTAYVYFNYGMYWLFNLLVKGGSHDGLILIRALDPRLGIAEMRQRRQKEKLTDLCSGPGKLALALGIGGIHHGIPMTGRSRPSGCGLRTSPSPVEVVSDIRVGISQAVDFPWRYLARDNPHVSVKHGRVKLPSVK
ncbi:DNA-3-methyladenine glycosylase [Prosthecobacter fusiformis]|uniref:Putative 3-methyladenine DNA glycosylase n=1 Tax=Prosthecobacter fusiformis TaxID=48464 RepID=A0A4R7SRT8_9BACT|nr:DNA-3-methyladenine glycosylase [Prosthecobacter fusiformis]TDU81704.1 DNA-3-methyladenine glycosylase [Prosthecobacter fusiformis]